MQIGIDSFASANTANNNSTAHNNVTALSELLERIEQADQSGLDVFGI